MKNKNQSQAGVNRHTSSEEVEMVKHSPGTQNHTESEEKVTTETPSLNEVTSGSAPSGDDEILKEVLKETIMKYNGGHTRSNVIRTFKGAIKKALQLKGQADDKKFDDWKKRLKEEANKHLFGEVMRKMIDKLSGGLG